MKVGAADHKHATLSKSNWFVIKLKPKVNFKHSRVICTDLTSPSRGAGQPYMGSDSDLIWVRKNMLFYRKCMTTKQTAITTALFLEVLKNAYLILLRELCWNRCLRHPFQLSVEHYFPGGAPLPESLETSTGVWLIVDTSLGSLALNTGGRGRFELVSIVSRQSDS